MQLLLIRSGALSCTATLGCGSLEISSQKIQSLRALFFYLKLIKYLSLYERNPLHTTPLIINGLVLWDYTERAYQYEPFLMYSEDFVPYSPVKFERL